MSGIRLSHHNADASSVEGANLRIRHDLRPGDLGAVVHLHGTLYAKEHGFDETFEAYVAGPMAEFVKTRTPRDRLWIAERGSDLVGCIAVVGVGASGPLNHAGKGSAVGPAHEHGPETAATDAQLRWFLVHPSDRGCGLGKHLLGEAVEFSRACGYRSIILWTVSSLAAAARLYRAFGFDKVEEKAGRMWGVDVIEEKYTLRIGSGLP